MFYAPTNGIVRYKNFNTFSFNFFTKKYFHDFTASKINYFSIVCSFICLTTSVTNKQLISSDLSGNITIFIIFADC